MPSPTCTSHLTHEKELRSIVLFHLLLPRPTAFLMEVSVMELRQTLRAWASHPSHVRQKEASKNRGMNSRDNSQGSFSLRGIPAELLFHHGVQLGSVCVSGDAGLKPLPVASVRGAELNPSTRTLLSDPGPAWPRGVPWELARGRLLRGRR